MHREVGGRRDGTAAGDLRLAVHLPLPRGRQRQIDRAEDEKYLVTAERVLELAKNAKSLWEARSPSERRDFLERLVCNPRLEGRTVRYDVRKPFDVILKMAGSEGWRPQRTAMA